MGNLRSYLLVFLLGLFTFAQPNAYSQCERAFAERIIEVQGERAPRAVMGQEMSDALTAFAREHNLPISEVEVGPEGRKIKRTVVGLDVTNEALMKLYLEKFHLEGELSEKVKGTLVLEFQFEHEGEYVTGVLRTKTGAQDVIYRWGREDLTRDAWVNEWLNKNIEKDPVIGFSHLIGLERSEIQNIETYLKNEQDRAPCKSSNCVAWTSSIELGKTAPGVTDAQRNFLFTELGMSRSTAHFEIARRLIHASNERHRAMIVFLNGEKGHEAFKRVEDYLGAEPKIPFENVIKDFEAPVTGSLKTAMEQVGDGAKVFFPIAAGASPEGFNALTERAKELPTGLDVHVLVNGISASAFEKGIEKVGGDKFRVHALFLGGNLRKLHSEGRVSVVPGYLGDFPKHIRDQKVDKFNYDAIVVRVSEPDAQGRYSLGPNHGLVMTILEARPNIKIIAEVNPNVPKTRGSNFLTKEQITAEFKSEQELAGPPVVPLTQVETTIGQHLGTLVESGATLQVGIGNIFGGLAQGLQGQGRQNIRIHSEMFGDSLKETMELGIAREAVTGFAFGSKELYNWLNGNQQVIFESTEKVNDPAKIKEIDGFHAINTALQVSLIGEVNATMGPNGYRISSPGGQVEFMSGAAKAKDGKAIIAIRSTAKEESISTITLDLYRGPVTTPHESVTHVVTEYGIAHLAGKSLKERAIAMINIAHPKFRRQLFNEARESGLIQEKDSEQIKFD